MSIRSFASRCFERNPTLIVSNFGDYWLRYFDKALPRAAVHFIEFWQPQQPLSQKRLEAWLTVVSKVQTVFDISISPFSSLPFPFCNAPRKFTRKDISLLSDEVFRQQNFVFWIHFSGICIKKEKEVLSQLLHSLYTNPKAQYLTRFSAVLTLPPEDVLLSNYDR